MLSLPRLLHNRLFRLPSGTASGDRSGAANRQLRRLRSSHPQLRHRRLPYPLLPAAQPLRSMRRPPRRLPASTFQVPVVLNGATDVASVALQFHYDPARLQLVNVSPGDFLSRDGQAAPPIHADEPAGNLVVGISRPPGTHGISGTGVVCVLTFQAKASGPSDLAITRASVVNGAQQQLPVASAQTSIVVK